MWGGGIAVWGASVLAVPAIFIEAGVLGLAVLGLAVLTGSTELCAVSAASEDSTVKHNNCELSPVCAFMQIELGL